MGCFSLVLFHFAETCGLTFHSKDMARFLINTLCAYSLGQRGSTECDSLFHRWLREGGVRVTRILTVDGERRGQAQVSLS